MNTNYRKSMLQRAIIILFVYAIFTTGFMLQAQNSNPVGAIPGVIDVSPMGAATYTIPIEVVPGTQGMQPNLSIVYNSMSGMGNLGMKWSLAGLSAITRCGQTPYYDDNITAIQFNGNDRFCIDGNRLVLISGAYGTAGAQYATEAENFTRYFSNSDNSILAYTDDGTIIEYGKTSDSKHTVATNKVLSWYINKITDADGNYMTFSYGQTNGEVWINEINYTGNVAAVIKTYAKVKFDYTGLPDDKGKNTYFVGGYGIPKTKLLTFITVSYNSAVVRKYQFNYNLNISGECTAHLKEIVLSDGNGTQLKATTIEWGVQSNNQTEQTLSNFPAEGYIITGDFNGDGYTDYIAYGLGSDKKNWKFYAGSATGTFTEKGTGNTDISLNVEENCYFYKADINGDGCDELIIAEQLTVNPRTYRFKILSLKNGTTQIGNSISIENFHQVLFGDFDGDGKTDMLFVKKDWYNNCSFLFYINFEFTSGALGLPSLNLPCKVRVGDFNGDGKTDIELNYNNNDLYICSYNNATGTFSCNSPSYSLYSYDRYSGDFNGDGITDLLTYTVGGSGTTLYWKVSFGKGDGTYTNPTSFTDLHPLGEVLQNGWIVPKYKIMIADLNGDGKDDIIQLIPSSITTLRTLYSKGCMDGTYKYAYGEKIIPGNFPHPKNFNIADFNHDGILDLMVQAQRGDNPRIVYLHQNKQYEFPIKIKDGMGKIIELNYRHKYLIAESSCWNDVFPNRAKKYFLSVADVIKISNGIGIELNTWKYQYEFPVFSLPRRTFLGFKEFVCENSRENKKEFYSFKIDDASNSPARKQVIVPVKQVTSINNQVINETLYTYKLKNLASNRYMPYSNETTIKDMIADIKTLITTTLNDNTGRLEKTDTRTYEQCNANNWLHSETNTYTYNTITLNGNQKKTVPTKILTTQQFRNNGTLSPIITDTLTCNYSGIGRLYWARQGNLHGSITTTYSNYTPAGLYREKTVSAAGCVSRVEKYEYDATQRFITKITNPVNHTTIFTYDPKIGNKLSEKDANNLTTTYSYNSFGNLTQVIYPDGTQTNISVDWYTSSFLPNARYTTYTTTTGKPFVRIYYDVLGREICRREDGNYFETQYNNKGQVQKTSYPFANFIDPRIWHEYEYDYLGRKIEETAPYIYLSYNYNTPKKVTVTDHLRNNISSYKHYDALGRITQAKDEGGTVNYTYAVTGSGSNIRHKTTIETNGATTAILSDLWGNRRSITEPNAGEITSNYNGFNELTIQVDARGNTTNYQYDKLGRVTQKQFVGSGGALQNIIYQYDENAAGGTGKVYRIRMGGVDVEGFSYDALGRLIYHSKIIDNVSYTYEYTYTSNGQLHTLTYPTGFSVKYGYDETGKLDEIRRNDNNSLIYRVTTRSSRYHTPTRVEYGNGVMTNYTYNPYGLLTRIQTGKKVLILIGGGGGGTTMSGGGPITEPAYTVDSTFLNYRYTYNDRGLMVSRSESVINRLENYTYDNLDRLTGIKSGVIGGGKLATQTLSYHNNGNIIENSTMGAYTYGTKPHAVTEIELGKKNPVSTNICDVAYNFFNQPTQVTEGMYELSLFYGANQQRHKMEMYSDGIKERTQYYINKRYEQENDHATNTTCDFNYIYGDNGVVALHISTYPTPPPGGGGGGQTSSTQTATDSIYYIHTDHLGSYCVVTNAAKQVRQRNVFDPWGNVVNLAASQNFTLTHRGFTGHEHYPQFKIINMNGRLYDPVIGRFFSLDKYVANSTFTQDFNRYTYARNNPLMYTDPSGEWIHLVIGAVIGGILNVAMNANKIDNFWQGLGYFGIGAAAGALSAGIGAGVNVAMAGGSFAAGFAGTAAGVASTGFGAGFVTGFASGFTSSFITGAGNSWMQGNSFGQGLFAGLNSGFKSGLIGGATGGLIGGIDSKMKGLDFWSGEGTFDLSNAYGASGKEIGKKTVTGKYVGKFEGVNMYEADIPGGVTLPGRGIIVYDGAFTRQTNMALVQHEFGHILQANIVGKAGFYAVIAPESLASATMHGKLGWNHDTFWTETWANYLSNNYFGTNSLLNGSAWPAANISSENAAKFFKWLILKPLF